MYIFGMASSEPARAATASAAAPAAASSGSSWIGLVSTLAVRALINPPLAVDLLRVAWRFRHRKWYARFPFLPLPAATYVKWRMYTAYGDEAAIPPARDVIAFARWVGKQP